MARAVAHSLAEVVLASEDQRCAWPHRNALGDRSYQKLVEELREGSAGKLQPAKYSLTRATRCTTRRNYWQKLYKFSKPRRTVWIGSYQNFASVTLIRPQSKRVELDAGLVTSFIKLSLPISCWSLQFWG